MSEQNRKNIYEDAQIIRSMIQHENNLKDQRIRWYLTIQGLLFAAYGFSLKGTSDYLYWILSITGILVSISFLVEMQMSRTGIVNLRDWWKDYKPQKYNGPEVMGADLDQEDYFLFESANILPIVFTLAWGVIFYCEFCSKNGIN